MGKVLFYQVCVCPHAGRGVPHGIWSQVPSLVSGPRSFLRGATPVLSLVPWGGGVLQSVGVLCPRPGQGVHRRSCRAGFMRSRRETFLFACNLVQQRNDSCSLLSITSSVTRDFFPPKWCWEAKLRQAPTYKEQLPLYLFHKFTG